VAVGDGGAVFGLQEWAGLALYHEPGAAVGRVTKVPVRITIIIKQRDEAVFI
jgi:hypothetical protein